MVPTWNDNPLPLAMAARVPVGGGPGSTVGVVRTADRELADGLVLRRGRAADREAILALEVESFGPSDGPVVRSRLDDIDAWLVVEDPSAPDDVVGRIASASVLLSHRLRLGEVVLPVGQIENVATAPRLPAPAASCARSSRRTTRRPISAATSPA